MDRNKYIERIIFNCKVDNEEIYNNIMPEINSIFDDFEKKLKQYVENQKLTMALANDILKELESERAIKEYIIKECLNPLKKEIKDLKYASSFKDKK